MDGKAVGKGVTAVDVTIVTADGDITRYKKITTRTRHINYQEYSRTQLVKMIHSTDAAFLRLVVSNLRNLGCRFVAVVHDKILVDVHSRDLLPIAFQDAYMEMFFSESAEPTTRLTSGTDILQNYFTGASRSLIVDKDRGRHISNVSQFDAKGKRKLLAAWGDLGLPPIKEWVDTICYAVDRVEGENIYPVG